MLDFGGAWSNLPNKNQPFMSVNMPVPCDPKSFRQTYPVPNVKTIQKYCIAKNPTIKGGSWRIIHLVSG